MITTKQRVQVAKDRAIDELHEMVGGGYWNLTDEERQQIIGLAGLISLPDDSEETLKALFQYVNDEEELFFEQ